MIKLARKFGAVLMALTMIFAMAVTVSAEYFSLPRKADIDGNVIGSITEDGLTATFELVADSPKSVNFYIKGDALDPEFWNKSDAYVEIDLTLNTDTSSVYAVLPGFTSDWLWVNPTVWDKYLKYGQTVTLRESLSTYYDSFKASKPMLIRMQICSASSTVETVEVQVSNIRIVGGGAAEVTTTVATTTTEATTTTAAPVETEPEVIETEAAPAVTEEASAATEEAAATEQAPAETTTTAATTTTAKAEEQTTAATTTTAAAPATTATYTSTVADGSADLIKTLTIVVIAAAVLVVGAIVGYIIYKSKSKY